MTPKIAPFALFATKSLPLALGLLLAACAPKQQTVQEETPAVIATPVSTSTAATSGAQTNATAVASPVVTDPMTLLDDPRSPLANRVVYFEFDRSEIQQQHLAQLETHARFLVANPGIKIRLEGHGDERGTREYNIGLGDRRAQAVRRLLMFQGAAASQLVTVSYGEEKPAADGHDEGAWSRNRRVELVYQR